MTHSVRQRLEEAAGAGGVLRIVYHGGSQPRSVREIVPVAVSDGYLTAHDQASGIRKVFNLAKVEIADATVAAPAYDPTPAVEDTRWVQAMFEERLGELRTLGWHVEISRDAIGLHRFFKNGEPRKSPAVQLDYAAFVTDCFVELDGRLIENTRASKLPYHVRSERLATHSFARASRAVAAFWDEARHLAPTGAS